MSADEPGGMLDMKGKNLMTIDGKSALVTGGASGIGYAISLELARRGAKPILVDINEERMNEAVRKLRIKGYDARGYNADITDVEQVKSLKNRIERDGLDADILVNCAGITMVAHATFHSHCDWKKIIDINLMGTVNMVDVFMPSLMQRGKGHIVNIGSIDGLLPIPNQAAYCASKFAITGMTEVLHYDLAHCGIGVTLVCPGYVRTPMSMSMPLKDIPTDFRGAKALLQLTKVFGCSPEKIAIYAADAVERDKFLVIPGAPSRLFYFYRRHFPKTATASGLAVARILDKLRSKLKERIAYAKA